MPPHLIPADAPLLCSSSCSSSITAPLLFVCGCSRSCTPMLCVCIVGTFCSIYHGAVGVVRRFRLCFRHQNSCLLLVMIADQPSLESSVLFAFVVQYVLEPSVFAFFFPSPPGNLNSFVPTASVSFFAPPMPKKARKITCCCTSDTTRWKIS